MAQPPIQLPLHLRDESLVTERQSGVGRLVQRPVFIASTTVGQNLCTKSDWTSVRLNSAVPQTMRIGSRAMRWGWNIPGKPRIPKWNTTANAAPKARLLAQGITDWRQRRRFAGIRRRSLRRNASDAPVLYKMRCQKCLFSCFSFLAHGRKPRSKQ